MTYLDWAASAPPDAHALDEAREVSVRLYANPSSPHAAGRQAAERLAGARARFAAALGVDPAEIIFTSGGTEANSSLLVSLLDRARLGGVDRPRGRLVTTEITLPGLEAVHDIPMPKGRGFIFNRVFPALWGFGPMKPFRGTYALLEFG